MKKKTKKNNGIYKIVRKDQLAALSVPVRQLIVDAVAAANRPCSVKDISKRIGRPADSLYFHITKLVKTELLLESQAQKIGGKDVVHYSTPARYMRIHYDLGSPDFCKSMSKIAGGIFRLAERDFVQCLSSDKSQTEGTSRNAWVSRIEGWTDPKTLAELNRQAKKLVETLSDEQTNKKSQTRVALTISLAHLE